MCCILLYRSKLVVALVLLHSVAAIGQLPGQMEGFGFVAGEEVFTIPLAPNTQPAREAAHVVDDVSLYDGTRGWKKLPTLNWHKGGIVDATFLPTGHLATLTPAGDVKISHASTGKLIQTLKTDGTKVVRLLMAPDSTRLLGITRSGGIQQWALPRPKQGWSPEQALGPPDSGRGDNSLAWASLTEDDEDEWLVLEYAEPVKAVRIHVYENHCPGALVRITTFGKDQKKLILWDGKDTVETIDGRQVARLKVIDPEPVQRIKLYLNSKKVPGWNEIDAVGLEDEAGKIHWAVAAGASTTYAARAARPGVVLDAQHGIEGVKFFNITR